MYASIGNFIMYRIIDACFRPKFILDRFIDRRTSLSKYNSLEVIIDETNKFLPTTYLIFSQSRLRDIMNQARARYKHYDITSLLRFPTALPLEL